MDSDDRRKRNCNARSKLASSKSNLEYNPMSAPLSSRTIRHKKPGIAAGLFVIRWTAIAGPSGRLFLGGGFRLRFLGGLRPTPRALGERAFDLLDRFGLGDFLHRRDFARQPVEGGFVEQIG